jgi:hypothetical protein
MQAATSIDTPSKPLSDREKVVAYIRRKGVVGKLDDAFISGIDWTVRGKALSKALAVTTCYSADAEGAQAFIDDLLALQGTDLRTVPHDADVRIVSRWMEDIRQQILAGEGEAE